MNEELLRKMQAHGPWHTHCDGNTSWRVCHFCGKEADQGKHMEEQTHIHNKDCLWLELVIKDKI